MLAFSVFLRVGLIFYSEWHDAHSVVKYTDVDYRVFSDATHFVLHPGPEYHYNRAQGLLSRWFVIGECVCFLLSFISPSTMVLLVDLASLLNSNASNPSNATDVCSCTRK